MPGDGEFGRPCTDDTTHSECECPAPTCAIQPGETEGVCTVEGCAMDPDLCPDSYRCLDLSSLGADFPSFCISN